MATKLPQQRAQVQAGWRLPKDLHEEARVQAIRRGISTGALVAEALRQYLGFKEPKRRKDGTTENAAA